MSLIDTEVVSSKYREKAINLNDKSVSITNFYNSLQERDIKEKPNCSGYGRIRHFKFQRGKNWPINPLPILPAAKALGIDTRQEIRAQVFQNSVCNWRCWYCFVDFKLLAGNSRHSSFKTCEQLLDLFLKEANRPRIIDLTGGQPDLTPEWIPWMMESLIEREMEEDIYLWSDDNLSNDFFWKYLTNNHLDLMQKYKMYGRVCCFKGIDGQSFSQNTLADPKYFENQFQLVKRLKELDMDIYFYITLTATTSTNFENVVPRFFDKIQEIHQNLPLRVVPLEVRNFTPVIKRTRDSNKGLIEDLLKGQYLAVKVWEKELSRRFSRSQLELPITEVST